MSAFEFVFSLFGLILGFILIEVLGGFVRMIKLTLPGGTSAPRSTTSWLTPLLGLFLLLDISSFWANLWTVREALEFGIDTVFACLAISSAYYFAASSVFPDEPSEWADLDRWFWRHRRLCLSCLIAVNLAWVLFFNLLTPPRNWAPEAIAQMAYFVPLAIAAWSTKAGNVVAALTFLIMYYLTWAGVTFALRLHWLAN